MTSILSISQARGLLFINKHALDDELEVQAETLYHIVEEQSKANGQLARAKNHLESVEAGLFQDFSDQTPKPTKDLILAQVQDSADRAKAFDLFLEAKEVADRWNGLFEAWRARGFALRELCGLHLANYYSSDSVSPSQVRRRTAEEVNSSLCAEAAGKRQESKDQERRPARRRVVE